MEPAPTPLRLRLILGKFQVKSTSVGLYGRRIAIDVGNSVTLSIDCPAQADVKLGDLLTLYTEVLANGNPNPTNVQ